MKIANRSSIVNYDVSQQAEARQLQITRREQQPSQIAAQTPLTEIERNQRVGEFKNQEQLVRANLKQQIQEPELEKQSIRRHEGPRQELAALRRLRREILRDGESQGGRYNRKDLADIETRIRELNQILFNRAIRELQRAPERDVLGPDPTKNK